MTPTTEPATFPPPARPLSHLATALAAWKQGLKGFEEGYLVVKTEVWT